MPNSNCEYLYKFAAKAFCLAALVGMLVYADSSFAEDRTGNSYESFLAEGRYSHVGSIPHKYDGGSSPSLVRSSGKGWGATKFSASSGSETSFASINNSSSTRSMNNTDFATISNTTNSSRRSISSPEFATIKNDSLNGGGRSMSSPDFATINNDRSTSLLGHGLR